MTATARSTTPVLDSAALATIKTMLWDGFSLSLRITSYPNAEDGIESWTVLFDRPEFGLPGPRDSSGDKEWLEVYSGSYSYLTLSEAVIEAASRSRAHVG